MFAPYFSSKIVEGKHGIVFLRRYQTVVDLKKKRFRKMNLDQTENSENTAYQFVHQVVKITKLLNLRYKNENIR